MKRGRYNFSPCQTDRTSVAQLHEPPGGALECNLIGRCPFFKSLHNPLRKKIWFLIPCFEIFRLQNNRETKGKTIAYCS